MLIKLVSLAALCMANVFVNTKDFRENSRNSHFVYRALEEEVMYNFFWFW